MDEKRYLKRKEKALNDGNREQLANSCNNLGDYYNREGKYQHAVKEYLEEAELYSKLGKKLEMAKAHRMAGEMFMLLCDFDKAREHIHIYLKTVKKLQNKVEEQRAYATLGRAHLLHGQSTSETSASITLEQLKEAEKAFLKSLLLIKELGGQITKLEQLDMQARCYLNIGVVKEHMGDFEESSTYIERAIKICKSHDLFELTHLCYISMSLLFHCKKNDATKALRYCNLALEAAKRLPNKVQKICETLITKAEILVKAGDFASAKQILTKAYKKNTPNADDRSTIERMLRIVVKICQTLDELVTTSSVNYDKCKSLYEKLGDGCCHLQNYSRALEYYHKMLECAERKGETGKDLTPIYVSLYQTYKDNHDFSKALEYLWKEYEINKDIPSEAFATLCGIADICELQNQSFWTIQDVYQKARAQLEKVENEESRKKMEKIVFVRLKKLQMKHKMHTLAELLEQDAVSRGIDLNCSAEEESETESDAVEQNTPDLGADVCLDDLTDSEASDLDETEKERPHRATRGARCLTIKRNNKGETQLHQACIAGNLELVRRLLDQGHAVNVRDHAGWLPLHEACNHGFRDIVELLLDRGANAAINDKGGTSCDGITPLYDACVNGFLEVVELLLERGADATVRTDFGETCVNGLDKWRRATTLTTGEQAYYHQIRATLLRPLTKVGIAGNATNAAPLTNANVDHLDELESRCATNAYSTEEDDDDDGITCSSSRWASRNQRRVSESGRVRKESNKSTKNASLEYKNVMEQLKHPNRLLDDDIYGDLPSSTSASLNNSKQKRNALLNSEEVDDDWLIDDVGPEKKKRRYLTPTTEFQRVSQTEVVEHESTYANELDTIGQPIETDAYQLLLDAPIDISQTQASRTKQTLSNHRNSRSTSSGSRSSLSLSKRNKAKHQASLIDSGFSRFRSESPKFDEGNSNTNSLSTGAEADSTTTAASIHLIISPRKTSPIQIQATQLLGATICFKIKVEDELLLVPIERKKLNDVNIRWLAEEAARRYYNLIGLKPQLRLKTADGFAYEENDPVSVAVEQNMILGTVLEWTTAPLPQKYEEMCLQLKKDVNTEVQRALEHGQASGSIILKGFWLTAQQTEPIFKALFHQTHLRVLNLSYNCMQNEGCRQLTKALVTLKQLRTLNLKGNFITSNGLEAILLGTPSAQLGDNVEKLEELEELNISQNPLGNESIRILHKFCNGMDGTHTTKRKSLQKLSLSQCGITNLYDYDLCYYQLTDFDIGYNQLNSDSRFKMLRNLNSSRMQCLNLNFTCDGTSTAKCEAFAEQIAQFFESGTCEKFKRIELAACGLTDVHMYRMMECLNKASGLEQLDIMDNSRLSASTLQYIIDGAPQLRKLIATNCNRLVDLERIQILEQLKQQQQIPNLMYLTLGDADDNSNNNNSLGSTYSSVDNETHRVRELKSKLCTLWQTHWRNEKANVISYGNNLVLYTNEKDLE